MGMRTYASLEEIIVFARSCWIVEHNLLFNENVADRKSVV